VRTRRGDAEVERTKPGSTLEFRLEYDNSKKWTDDDPRDGIGPEGELEEIFDELDVKRMVKKLEKAVKSYLNGDKGAQDKLRAIGKEMDRVLGADRALTVVRHLKGSVDNDKVKKALEIAKDVIGGKKAMDRFDRIAMKVAREMTLRQESDMLNDSVQKLYKKLKVVGNVEVEDFPQAGADISVSGLLYWTERLYEGNYAQASPEQELRDEDFLSDLLAYAVEAIDKEIRGGIEVKTSEFSGKPKIRIRKTSKPGWYQVDIEAYVSIN
jgi:hypothetical protein